MRKTLNGKRFASLLLLLAILSVGFQTVHAAAETPPIALAYGRLTRENIHTLTQIAQIGRGALVDAFWSPDGEMIAMAAGTGVYLLDGNTLDLIALLPSGYAKLASWSGDGSLLAVCGSPADEIQLWNIEERRILYSIAHERIISALWVNQEKGEILALGQQKAGADKYGVTFYKSYLDTYSLKNGKRKKSVSFQSGDKQTMHLTLSPGGKTIFGAGINEYYIWNFSGKQLYKAPVPIPMSNLGVSDGSQVAVLNIMSPNTVKVINIKKNESAEIKLGAWAPSISLDASGMKLAAYTSEGYQVYDMTSLQLETIVPYKQYLTGDPRISGDLTRLLVIEESRLKLIHLGRGELLGEQEGFLKRAGQAAVSADRLAASKGYTSTKNVQFSLWDPGTLQEMNTETPQGLNNTITEIFFTPDGSRLATFGRHDRSLRFWKALDGTADGEKAFDKELSAACLSADGKMLAVGLGGWLDIWPLQGTEPVTSFFLDDYINMVSLSTDGSRAALSTAFGVFAVDVPGNEMLMRIKNAVMTVSSEEASHPVLSPDGKTMAVVYSGKKGYSVKLFNLDTVKTEWKATLGSDFEEMCFSPDGSMLAVSANDDGLLFLDAQSGKRLFTLDYPSSDFSFSSDGSRIITTSADGTVRTWGVP